MFIYELKLKTNQKLVDQLNRRFRMAEDIYKTTLREILKRVRKQNKDPRKKALTKTFKRMLALKEAIANPETPKETVKALKKELKTLEAWSKDTFKALDKDYGLDGNFTFGKFANDYRNQRGYGPYVGSDIAGKLGHRAWAAYEKVKFNKGANRVNLHGELLSMEGSKDAVLIIRNGLFKMGTKQAKLEVPVIYNNDEFERAVLANDLKYNRLVRRFENGKWQFYVQTVFDGTPPQEVSDLKGTVGVDVGLNRVAVSSPNGVYIFPLAEGVKDIEEEVADLQRQLDHKRRLNNPDNYNDDGTVKRGPKVWHTSKRYLAIQRELAELKRKQAASRKIAHKTLANHLVDLGDSFVIRVHDVKALVERSTKDEISEKTGQNKSKKRAGKLVARTAPSLLVAELTYKATFQNKPVTIVKAKDFNSHAYNHKTKTFDEKVGDTRVIDDQFVQTQLYSAFMLSQYDYLDDDDRLAYEFERFISHQDAFLDGMV